MDSSTFSPPEREGGRAATDAPNRIPDFEVDRTELRLATTTPSNVRAAPSVDAGKLTTLAKGTVVRVTGKVRGRNWYRVELDGGREAYLHESLLVAIEQTPDPPPAVAAIASASSSAVAPEAPEQVGEPLRIGLFPFESVVPCFVPVGRELEDAVAEQLSNQPDVELGYSIFWPRAARDDIPPANSLWDQNMAHREPDSNTVRKAGSALDLDAVIMAWYHCSQIPRMGSSRYKVEVYLLDVATGARYHSKQSLTRADEAVAEVLSDYLVSKPDRSTSTR